MDNQANQKESYENQSSDSLSNENSTLVEVYFDDVVVTHTKSNLIQGNEYYPFGMQTANSWTRESVTGNRYLANGGTELNSTTGQYDLFFRNYDPAIGRMSQVDPMASKYGSITPYNYSLNNPSNVNDPLGDDVEPQRPEGREYYCAMCWREGDNLTLYGMVSGGGATSMGSGWSPGGGGLASYLSQSQTDGVRYGWNPDFAGPVLVTPPGTRAKWISPTIASMAINAIKAMPFNDAMSALAQLNLSILQSALQSEDYKANLTASRKQASRLDPPDESKKMKILADYVRNTPVFAVPSGLLPFTFNIFYKAEAIFGDYGVSINGTEYDNGAFFILAGIDAGRVVSYDELTTVGVGTDMGGQIEHGRIDYSGDPNGFETQFLFGFRQKFSVSASVPYVPGLGIGVSRAVSEIKVGEKIETVVGFAVTFGYGLGWLNGVSGSYNQGIIYPKKN